MASIKKIIFIGTPEFAVPSLQALYDAEDIEVLAVITQPDKATGRKQIITAPPTKVLAKSFGLTVFQPEKISQDQELISQIKKLKPDYLITVAYGQILKASILELAPVINLHASLLPEFRGPAPINWMIFHGDKKVGLTTMLTDQGIDTGAMLLQTETDLDENENAAELSLRLSHLGAKLLLKTITEFDKINPQQQQDLNSPRQFAPFMDKNLGLINFTAQELILKSANPKQSDFIFKQKNSAKAIHNLIRGSYPWPGAWFIHNAEKIIVLAAKVNNKETDGINVGPSTITKVDKKVGSFCVSCIEGELEILKLKAQGKNEMRALDWLNGQRLKPGDKLN